MDGLPGGVLMVGINIQLHAAHPQAAKEVFSSQTSSLAMMGEESIKSIGIFKPHRAAAIRKPRPKPIKAPEALLARPA